MELEIHPLVVAADSGALKHPLVGWDFCQNWSFEWVFFALEAHSGTTHRVGILMAEWEFT